MEAPEKIYLYPSDRAGVEYEAEWEDDIHKLFSEKGKKVKFMIVEEE